MRMLTQTCRLAAFVLSAIACTASKPDVSDDFSNLGSLDQKTDSFSSRMKIVGSLDYGQTSTTVSYTKTPRYRAFKFGGNEDDVVDVWVRSTNGGDAVAWILDNDFHILAVNDDADDTTYDAHVTVTLPANASITHYVVFRDYDLRAKKFQVQLDGTPAATCAVDADCALVNATCCSNLGKDAVPVGDVAAHDAALGCAPHPICPLIMTPDKGTVAICGDDHACHAASAGAYACGGMPGTNRHACADGWICAAPGEESGVCEKPCGGFGNLGCPVGLSCTDNPFDACDPAHGGADCGGLCE